MLAHRGLEADFVGELCQYEVEPRRGIPPYGCAKPNSSYADCYRASPTHAPRASTPYSFICISLRGSATLCLTGTPLGSGTSAHVVYAVLSNINKLWDEYWEKVFQSPGAAIDDCHNPERDNQRLRQGVSIHTHHYRRPQLRLSCTSGVGCFR